MWLELGELGHLGKLGGRGHSLVTEEVDVDGGIGIGGMSCRAARYGGVVHLERAAWACLYLWHMASFADDMDCV